MRRVLVLGVVLAVFQQWCGINVIFNYAEEIFRAAGYDISDVLKNIAWTGSVNLVFTFVALGAVDRGGRRPLMLFGSAGLAVIYTAMGLCYHGGVKGLPMLLLVLAAIGCYAHVAGAGDLGGDLGDLPQPHPRRGHVGGRDGAVDRLLHPHLHVPAPERQRSARPARSGSTRRICVAGFVFILRKLPETKGKTLEEIERQLVEK